MDGTIDFIILEHDDVAGCALIAGAVDGVVSAIDGYNTPYVVAKGYDHATRNWEVDRLGGKIELCVDSIDQDIEKVRAFAGSSPVVRAFVEPLCAYIPAPSDSVGEQKRDISPYLRQTAQRCRVISHPIDPPETASAATRATFGGTAAWPVYRGHKN